MMTTKSVFDQANDLKTIIDALSSAKQDEQEVPRPLPPPEPPPPPPRWPWSGTNKKSDPTKHVNGVCHEIYAVKALAGGVLFYIYMWPGTTLTISKTTQARMNERIPHKPPPPAEPI